MFLVFSAIIYLLMIFILSIKEKEVELSDFEIQRRISNGEKRFEKTLFKKQIVPIYNRFRNFASVLVAVALALSNAQFLPFFEAMLTTFLLMLFAFTLSRTDFMKKFSRRIFQKITPKLYILWNFLSPKNRRRILQLNKRQMAKIYSKAEMLDFLGRQKQVIGEREMSWVREISNLSEKTLADFEFSKNDLDILHEKDLLTPLVIDELYKTKQPVFVVMDKDDAEVLGVVRMSKIGEIASDSKRVRTIMERDFMRIRNDKSALEVFEKMIRKGEYFAITTNRKGEFSGVLVLNSLLRDLY
ncbi:MAG: hypothetical protein Q4A27_01165 [bacterium]|nr:hypothetical protein [bacterium]